MVYNRANRQKGHDGIAMWIVVALCLGLSACTKTDAPLDLPVPPSPSLDELAPAVRTQVQAAYEQARSAPQDPQANGELGMLLQAHGRFGAAAAWYQRARGLDPEAFRWAYYHGLALEEQGQPDEAIAVYRHALSLDPGYAAARLRLAALHLAGGQVEESRKQYDTVLGNHPHWPEAHLGYGRLLRQEGALDAAIAQFQRALDLGGPFGAAHYALALAYRQQGDTARADEHFGLFEQYEDVKLTISDSLRVQVEQRNVTDRPSLLRANRLLQQGRVPEAIQAYLQAIEQNPQSITAYEQLIFLYGRLRQLEQAEVYHARAEALGPKGTKHHFNLAEVYLSAGRYAEATTLYRRVVATDSTQANAYAQLGDALERQGATAEAIPHYEMALQIDPHHRQAHFSLGRYRASQGRYDEAIAHLQKAVEVEDATTAPILYLMAAVYIKMNRQQEAVSTLERARDIAVRTRNSPLLARIEADLRRAAQQGFTVQP